MNYTILIKFEQNDAGFLFWVYFGFFCFLFRRCPWDLHYPFSECCVKNLIERKATRQAREHSLLSPYATSYIPHISFNFSYVSRRHFWNKLEKYLRLSFFLLTTERGSYLKMAANLTLSLTNFPDVFYPQVASTGVSQSKVIWCYPE